MGPINIYGNMRVDSKYKCCGCFHVKTGAICLGLYNLVLQFFALCVLILAVVHPATFFYVTDDGQVNNETELYLKDGFQFGTKETLPQLPTPIPQVGPGRGNDYQSPVFLSKNDLVLITQKSIRTGEAHLAVVLLFGLIVITSLMIYGVIKSRPLYLLPFFCFQVLDLVLACVSAIGHYTWMPSIQTIIEKNPDIPFRDHLLSVNSQWATIGFLFFFVLMLILKAYFIDIVWSCYQYLHFRNTEIIRYTDDSVAAAVAQAYLPPDYESAGKLPPVYETPPPPYRSL